MNKKDLFFTYVLAFICIACCLTLHYPTKYHFPFMVFALLVGIPLLLRKKIFKKPYFSWKSIDKTTINNKFIIFMDNYPLTSFYIIITFFALLVAFWFSNEEIQTISSPHCGENCYITTTKTIEKADEIQTFLAQQNCLTESQAMFNNKNEVIGYKIKLKNKMSQKDYFNAISELLDTSIVDKSVEYPISSTYYRIKIDKPEGNKFRFIFKAYSPK